MNLFAAKRFIHYLLMSKHRNGHGIHSPFVFNIVSNIFRNKIDPDIVFKIETIRKKLLASREVLEMNDLGAGSKRIKTRSRKVSDVTRYSTVPGKYGILLANMAGAFGKPLIIELGTSFGLSTMYMASIVNPSPVVSIEGCSSTASVAEACFNETGLDNIRLMRGSFKDLLPVLSNEDISPGLVFIDGDHRKEPLLEYFDQITAMSKSDTVVIIDDINHSPEMAEAWEVIKNNPGVTLTIDIFRMGIVFFKEGLTRFNYMIRY